MSEPIPIKRARKEPPLIDDEFTDKWAARLFSEFWIKDLRFIKDRSAWMMWTGSHWRTAFRVDLDAKAKEFVDDILVRAIVEPDQRRRAAFFEWARKACSLAKLRAIAELAASEEILWEESSKFDSHPDLFNCANGTVDLSTGKLRAHERRDLLTKVSPVAFDPGARSPRFIQFVDEVFDNRLDLVMFAQRAIGYTLTGHTREHVFFLLHGVGLNGKSLFVKLLSRILGDYGRTAAIETFTMKRPNAAQASPDLASLAGARLVTAGETEAGSRLSEGLVKSITGGDLVTCRHLNEGLFSYLPTYKVWLFFNHRPQIRGLDAGIWRRVRLLPFDVSFEGRADKQLAEKLEAEAAGILAWAVRGAVEWFTNGLGNAEAVSAATAAYRDECDALAPFVEAKLITDANGTVTRKRVAWLYTTYCEQSGEEPMKAATLYRLLQDRTSVTPFKSDGERGFKGIREKTSC